MRTVASAKRPYDLHRVLNFESGDYAASSNQGLKYAQGYVLFHYMLHGVPGPTRDTFFDYLRSAVGGQGQASTFRRMFRKQLRALESGYRDYAQ